MKASIYDKYFKSLIQYTESSSAIRNVVTVNITNLNGFVAFEFLIPFKKIEDITIPILTLNLNWDHDNPLIINNTKNVLNIEKVIINNSDNIDVRYTNNQTNIYLKENISESSLCITFLSISSIIPLAESIPFNRYIFYLDFIVPNEINNDLLIKIVRNDTVDTRFTKGNYALSFPSRFEYDKRITNLYYNKQSNRQYSLKMGFSDTSKNYFTTSIYSLYKLSVFVLLLFIVLKFSEQLIIQILGGCIAIVLPFFDYIPNLFIQNRLKYYIGKLDISNISVSLNLFGTVSMLLVFVLHIANIYSNANLLLYESIFLFFISCIFMILLRIGSFERYTCDFNNCRHKFTNRLNAYNCYSTGRVVCKQCIKNYCKKCDIYKNQRKDTYESSCVELQCVKC